jgi:hypothetical protein
LRDKTGFRGFCEMSMVINCNDIFELGYSHVLLKGNYDRKQRYRLFLSCAKFLNYL